ncbi:alpha/beta hydrolase [Agilicoccus flavus]|uniref:alpha/beta hydrolase n=1 Tax=Agilicoccus flavus TaxID=2775968 RepID=UPI001CF6529F|nr:alpha/beta hydrolase [Agilicoccus flavus]
MRSDTFSLPGHRGGITAYAWAPDDEGDVRCVVLLAHGYGEHLGRYGWVVEQLVAHGAAVYGPDHAGHGRSEGERVLIEDIEGVVDDLDLVADRAVADHPGLPVVLLGHSMGGLIGARYTQRHGDRLTATVLSAPVLGRWEAAASLLGAAEIPQDPIDPATLSRDPEVGRAYVEDPLVWHGGFKRPTIQALTTALAAVRDAGAVDVPILWLHGQDDPLVPIEGSRQGWPGLAGSRGSSTTYPGARHEILNETNREEVLADVLAFVDTHVTGRDPAANGGVG